MATTVATGEEQAPFSEQAVEELRGRLGGEALTPSDPAYAEVRGTFNAMHADEPDLVVRCVGTADVVEAVNFARENGVEPTVRGGGHSIAGLSSSNGGMVIDLSAMNAVEVDPDARIARVQGGALWRDVDRETQAFGLATAGGVVSDTGVAGLTLGGGYGWLRRKHGLSCDNLVEAQIVCADGVVRKASAEVNPDLYWAIRGGGGNFGIATSFTFELHPLGPTVAFAATLYPIEEAADVMRRWRTYVEDAPDEVTASCVTLTFPANPEMPEVVHDRPVLVVGGVYAGDADEGLPILQPLRELGTALFDMSGPTPYTAVQSGFDPLFPRGELRAYWKSQYLDELSDEAIAVIAAKAQDRPAPITLVNTFHMGGAIAATGPDETAFVERQGSYMVSIDGMWTDPADDAANIDWVRSAWNEVSAFGNGRVYLNFTGRADEPASAGVDDAFGRNLRRLAAVKATYDPDNFFRGNNNIAPAAAE
jgi:FAD binding domain/Berberine and berberine like